MSIIIIVERKFCAHFLDYCTAKTKLLKQLIDWLFHFKITIVLRHDQKAESI